jgi:hypothetical protein
MASRARAGLSWQEFGPPGFNDESRALVNGVAGVHSQIDFFAR